ncbi:MAG: hypothetical protein IK090_03665 [Clostridia bacterium]|nr:hypothetical protein [Clostridia bacterium]
MELYMTDQAGRLAEADCRIVFSDRLENYETALRYSPISRGRKTPTPDSDFAGPGAGGATRTTASFGEHKNE